MASIDGEGNRTGLDDIECALVLKRLRPEDTDRLWYVTLNDHADADWVLVDGAPNQWDGTISDDGGNEVADLSVFAGENFERAWTFACETVAAHNRDLLTVMEPRGEADTRFYVLLVEGDIEPSLLGPFDTEAEQDAKARELKAEEGDESGIFWLNQTADGGLEVGSYSGGFFMTGGNE